MENNTLPTNNQQAPTQLTNIPSRAEAEYQRTVYQRPNAHEDRDIEEKFERKLVNEYKFGDKNNIIHTIEIDRMCPDCEGVFYIPELDTRIGFIRSSNCDETHPTYPITEYMKNMASCKVDPPTWVYVKYPANYEGFAEDIVSGEGWKPEPDHLIWKAPIELTTTESTPEDDTEHQSIPSVFKLIQDEGTILKIVNEAKGDPIDLFNQADCVFRAMTILKRHSIPGQFKFPGRVCTVKNIKDLPIDNKDHRYSFEGIKFIGRSLEEELITADFFTIDKTKTIRELLRWMDFQKHLDISAQIFLKDYANFYGYITGIFLTDREKPYRDIDEELKIIETVMTDADLESGPRIDEKIAARYKEAFEKRKAYSFENGLVINEDAKLGKRDSRESVTLSKEAWSHLITGKSPIDLMVKQYLDKYYRPEPIALRDLGSKDFKHPFINDFNFGRAWPVKWLYYQSVAKQIIVLLERFARMPTIYNALPIVKIITWGVNQMDQSCVVITALIFRPIIPAGSANIKTYLGEVLVWIRTQVYTHLYPCQPPPSSPIIVERLPLLLMHDSTTTDGIDPCQAVRSEQCTITDGKGRTIGIWNPTSKLISKEGISFTTNDRVVQMPHDPEILLNRFIPAILRGYKFETRPLPEMSTAASPERRAQFEAIQQVLPCNIPIRKPGNRAERTLVIQEIPQERECSFLQLIGKSTPRHDKITLLRENAKFASNPRVLQSWHFEASPFSDIEDELTGWYDLTDQDIKRIDYILKKDVKNRSETDLAQLEKALDLMNKLNFAKFLYSVITITPALQEGKILMPWYGYVTCMTTYNYILRIGNINNLFNPTEKGSLYNNNFPQQISTSEAEDITFCEEIEALTKWKHVDTKSKDNNRAGFHLMISANAVMDIIKDTPCLQSSPMIPSRINECQTLIVPIDSRSLRLSEVPIAQQATAFMGLFLSYLTGKEFLPPGRNAKLFPRPRPSQTDLKTGRTIPAQDGYRIIWSLEGINKALKEASDQYIHYHIVIAKCKLDGSYSGINDSESMHIQEIIRSAFGPKITIRTIRTPHIMNYILKERFLLGVTMIKPNPTNKPVLMTPSSHDYRVPNSQRAFDLIKLLKDQEYPPNLPFECEHCSDERCIKSEAICVTGYNEKIIDLLFDKKSPLLKGFKNKEVYVKSTSTNLHNSNEVMKRLVSGLALSQHQFLEATKRLLFKKRAQFEPPIEPEDVKFIAEQICQSVHSAIDKHFSSEELYKPLIKYIKSVVSMHDQAFTETNKIVLLLTGPGSTGKTSLMKELCGAAQQRWVSQELTRDLTRIKNLECQYIHCYDEAGVNNDLNIVFEFATLENGTKVLFQSTIENRSFSFTFAARAGQPDINGITRTQFLSKYPGLRSSNDFIINEAFKLWKGQAQRRFQAMPCDLEYNHVTSYKSFFSTIYSEMTLGTDENGEEDILEYYEKPKLILTMENDAKNRTSVPELVNLINQWYIEITDSSDIFSEESLTSKIISSRHPITRKLVRRTDQLQTTTKPPILCWHLDQRNQPTALQQINARPPRILPQPTVQRRTIIT